MRETSALILLAALLLLSCTVDEDLRVNSDGSGTYRARISVPKTFPEGFADLRKEAAKNGFTVVEEGETDEERFFVISKDFADIEALNDSHTHFELTMTNTRRFLRREYRLRAVLKAIAYGSFKRRFTVAMPGKSRRPRTARSREPVCGGRARPVDRSRSCLPGFISRWAPASAQRYWSRSLSCCCFSFCAGDGSLPAHSARPVARPCGPAHASAGCAAPIPPLHKREEEKPCFA